MRQIPLLTPNSDWRCPTELPVLRGRAKWISVDIETCDPYLKEKGMGFIRGDAFVAGIAIGADGMPARYYPIKHLEGGNLDKGVVKRWLKDQLTGDEPKIGANLQYDAGGLWVDLDVFMGGPWYDVLVAEALIDEESPWGYSLDDVAEKYLGEKKDEELLQAACQAYGLGIVKNRIRREYKGHLWKLPPKFVGPYAEQDANLPPRILEKQLNIIRNEGTGKVWEVEQEITKIVVEMWRQGVRIDVDAAERAKIGLTAEEKELDKQITSVAGRPLDVNVSADLVKLWEASGTSYPLTAQGNPSFTKGYLESCDHPVAKLVVKRRKVEKMRRDFVEGAILGSSVGGRIHSTFNQVRRDDSGTRSGRFSSQHPNNTQVPIRDPYYGPMIRRIYIPEEGCEWASIDVSQQEFRWTVHYGYLRKYPGAAEARQKYIDDPKADFHSMVARMGWAEAEGLLDSDPQFIAIRKKAKNMNLGFSYAMGVAKLRDTYGYTDEEAEELDALYHAAVPFIKGLNKEAGELADIRGWVRTALGRRKHFNLWEPARRPTKDDLEAKNHVLFEKGKLRWVAAVKEAAAKKWPGEFLRRAYTYRAYNGIVQGTAADQLKVALVNLRRDGILIPLIVHDECDDTSHTNKRALIIRDALINAIPCEVPMKCDIEVGKNWADLEVPQWALVA
jgi:DNA polymerase I-like protein with 3'-5' exonuclease and polymerase domains